MSSSSNWTWSERHNDHYRVTYENGNTVYHWAKDHDRDQASDGHIATNNAAQATQSGQSAASTGDSSSPTEATPPEPVASHVRERIPNLMAGTPAKGWYDPLDSSYRMRTGSEAKTFFRKGKVFSMLWAETASETWSKRGTMNTAITVGRFGERVYSQVRRFIVVKEEHGFVYAVAIYTYTGRGTLKPGCIGREHAAVFLTGSGPTIFQGEQDGPSGMNKEPIEITPADSTITMDPASRVRFGKTYPVEWNVKVKDIGKVATRHMTRLNMYWREHMAPADEPEAPDDEPTSEERAYTTTRAPYSFNPPHATAPHETAIPRTVYQAGGYGSDVSGQTNPMPQQQQYMNPYSYPNNQHSQYPSNAYQTNLYPSNQHPNNQYQHNQYPGGQYPNNPYQGQYPPNYPPR